MKKRTGILGVLIAVLALGIGYAAVSAVTLTITGTGKISPDENNFNVHYTGTITETKSDESITTTKSHNNKTTGEFTIEGMTQKGDEVSFTYTIINESEDLKATLAAPTVKTNTNEEYFQVTSTAAATSLAAGGATTTQTVTVKAIKTPIGEDDQNGSFTIELVATPDNS